MSQKWNGYERYEGDIGFNKEQMLNEMLHDEKEKIEQRKLRISQINTGNKDHSGYVDVDGDDTVHYETPDLYTGGVDRANILENRFRRNIQKQRERDVYKETYEVDKIRDLRWKGVQIKQEDTPDIIYKKREKLRKILAMEKLIAEQGKSVISKQTYDLLNAHYGHDDDKYDDNYDPSHL